jgi:ribose transport system ATP-binding protein
MGIALTQAGPAAERLGAPTALSIRRISKVFGESRVLNDVSLDIMPGEVHGLLGQNGSGKSTLIKILAGFYTPEVGGSIEAGGVSVPLPMSAGAASALGISFVHQHLGLIPSLTALENLLIEDMAERRFSHIDWARERNKAERTFGRFGLSIDPGARVGNLPQVDRALLAIVRAFERVRKPGAHGKGVLVLDEPTPFLPRAGVEQLFALVRRIASEGAAVIFVSHDIDEIKEITDRVSILRDGDIVGSLDTSAASVDDIIALIVGRRVELFEGRRRGIDTQPTAVAVRNASDDLLQDSSLQIRAGEIVGLTGLIGSGFDRLLSLIYGATAASTGELEIGGERWPLSSMTPAKATRAGVAFLPADRFGAAGAGNLTVLDNISLPILNAFSLGFGLDWRGLDRRARDLGSRYDVRPNDPSLRLSALSGGNAQKVLLAKWFQTTPKLMLLNEPVQGVDVSARQRILAAIDAAAGDGMAILIASTDSEILAQVCNRVCIFAKGRIANILEADKLNKHWIGEECLRHSGAAPIFVAPELVRS